MSTSVLADSITKAVGTYYPPALTARTKFDDALVRYDAWYLVFVAVILGLGATLLAGMAVWCVVYQGKRFTGSWSFANGGLSVAVECV